MPRKKHEWFGKTNDHEGDARYRAECEAAAAAEGMSVEEWHDRNLAEFRALPPQEKIRRIESNFKKKESPPAGDWQAPKSAGNIWYMFCSILDQITVGIGRPRAEGRFVKTGHPLITKHLTPEGFLVACHVKKVSQFRRGKSDFELVRLAYTHFGIDADLIEIAQKEGFLTEKEAELVRQTPPTKIWKQRGKPSSQ
jgi:hypothetical protein